MTPEEREWYIDTVKQRYSYLKLSTKQAEKVFDYEQQRDILSDTHFFTVWEEADFEQSTFSDILTTIQWKKYQSFSKKSIERYQQELTDADKNLQHEIAYYKDLIAYYDKTLLPAVRSSFYSSFAWLTHDRSKVEYLKEEYLRFINSVKKRKLVEHFRHNRQFQPNQLKVSLLVHKSWCLLPNYPAFRSEMDRPTAAIDEYLGSMMLRVPEEMEAFLTNVFDDLALFHEANRKKYYGELKGWHTVLTSESDAERKLWQAMTLLLLDDRYLKMEY